MPGNGGSCYRRSGSGLSLFSSGDGTCFLRSSGIRSGIRLAYKFDLLFRGLEITSGGQRIHDYQEQLDKMHAQGLDPNDFKYYLEAHKYGLPPHGGLGIGLERLVMKLLGLSNVRQASMFPRDINRLLP